MKKNIITTALVLLTCISANAQIGHYKANASKFNIFTPSRVNSFSPFQIHGETITPDKRTFYTEKSKKQKTTAWILLAGGTTLIATGFLIGNRSNSTFEEAAAGIVVVWSGVGACIASIPLFISARKYKAKATLSFNIQRTAPSVGKQISSLSLKIPFG